MRQKHHEKHPQNKVQYVERVEHYGPFTRKSSVQKRIRICVYTPAYVYSCGEK
jgi:hypothetical protein